MSAPGYLTPAELTWYDGVYIKTPTANAYKWMELGLFQATGLGCTIALPRGGYRSAADAIDMIVNPGRYGLNPKSVVSLADPRKGEVSGHMLGVCLDIGSFYGERRAWILANMGRYGFRRPFGEKDPNHLEHDGKTMIHPIPTPPKEVGLSDAEVAKIIAHIDQRFDLLDDRIDNVEAILAIDTFDGIPGGIRGMGGMVRRIADNAEDILAGDGETSIRGRVEDLQEALDEANAIKPPSTTRASAGK